MKQMLTRIIKLNCTKLALSVFHHSVTVWQSQELDWETPRPNIVYVNGRCGKIGAVGAILDGDGVRLYPQPEHKENPGRRVQIQVTCWDWEFFNTAKTRLEQLRCKLAQIELELKNTTFWDRASVLDVERSLLLDEIAHLEQD